MALIAHHRFLFSLCSIISPPASAHERACYLHKSWDTLQVEAPRRFWPSRTLDACTARGPMACSTDGQCTQVVDGAFPIQCKHCCKCRCYMKACAIGDPTSSYGRFMYIFIDSRDHFKFIFRVDSSLPLFKMFAI